MALGNIITRLKRRRGMGMTSVLLSVALIGILVIPVTKWYLSMTHGTVVLGDKMEMSMILQEYVDQLNASTYDEVVKTISSKGKTWTEDVGNGKYQLKVEFSDDGKFTDSLCDVGASAGSDDKHCRKAKITLSSKSDPSVMKVAQTTNVGVGGDSRIKELEDRIAGVEGRFGNYDTKSEADNKYACPWDYHLVNGKCVACPAPSNWKQYRSGNCTLGTCPPGQKANTARTGCDAITCPSGQRLQGDSCVVNCSNYQYLYNGSCHNYEYSCGGWDAPVGSLSMYCCDYCKKIGTISLYIDLYKWRNCERACCNNNWYSWKSEIGGSCETYHAGYL